MRTLPAIANMRLETTVPASPMRRTGRLPIRSLSRPQTGASRKCIAE